MCLAPTQTIPMCSAASPGGSSVRKHNKNSNLVSGGAAKMCFCFLTVLILSDVGNTKWFTMLPFRKQDGIVLGIVNTCASAYMCEVSGPMSWTLAVHQTEACLHSTPCPFYVFAFHFERHMSCFTRSEAHVWQCNLCISALLKGHRISVCWGDRRSG